MLKFKKGNESADNDIAKLDDVSEVDSTRKPSWVNLTSHLDTGDSILDKLVFKVINCHVHVTTIHLDHSVTISQPYRF